MFVAVSVPRISPLQVGSAGMPPGGTVMEKVSVLPLRRCDGGRGEAATNGSSFGQQGRVSRTTLRAPRKEGCEPVRRGLPKQHYRVTKTILPVNARWWRRECRKPLPILCLAGWLKGFEPSTLRATI